MDDGSPVYLIVLVCLIACSAFFSASETALTSLSKIRLRNMLDEKVKHADKIDKLLQNPGKLLSSILVGNNLVNIAASSLATTLAIDFFQDKPGSGAGFATAVMTVVILIFGEITPKTIAAQKAEKVALVVATLISWVVWIFTPVVALLNIVTGVFVRAFGCVPGQKAPLITEAELKTIVDVSHEEGVLEKEEKNMINNVFLFGDSKARDVMTPRTDMIMVPEDVSYRSFCEIVKEEGLSRLPVFGENADDIIGVLYAKDILPVREEEFSAKEYMREPFFTYESKPVDALFAQMRQDRIGLAIVLDEYGGTAGLVTMEDIVEEIVGDIEDEFDQTEEEIQQIHENEFIVDGSVRLEDLNERIGTEIENEEVDTIAGYVLLLLGNFPKGGEVIETDGLKIRVEEMEKNRIAKLRILLKEEVSE